MKTIAKGKAPKNLDEVAYKLAETWAALENDEIDCQKAQTISKIAKGITDVFKVKIVNQGPYGLKTQVGLDIAEFANANTQIGIGIAELTVTNT